MSKNIGNLNKMEELAKSKGLSVVDTEYVIPFLEHDILLDLYRRDPEAPHYSEEDVKFNLELNEKIRTVYKETYKNDWSDELLLHTPTPFCLNGAPGQGKTTAYVVAAKNVCKKLNLNFIRDVEESYKPSRNDFLFVVQDSAGKTSVLEYALPRAVSVKEKNAQGVEEENFYLKSALNWRFMCLNKAAGGVLLFDDAANASINVQNSFLQVAINKTFGGMKFHNAHIGFTGNLGSADGTYTNDLGSAFRNRVIMLFVRDTVENFIKRAYTTYTSDCGEMGLVSYLKRNPDDLSSIPEAGSSAGFNSPRSWDGFISKMINVLKRYGGRGNGEDAAMRDLRIIAPSMLGKVVGEKVVAFYSSLLLNADPIAKDAISKGKLNEAEFTKQYKEGGTMEAQTFGYQFGSACADYATNFVRTEFKKFENERLSEEEKEKKSMAAIREGTRRFGIATEQLMDNEFGFALTHFVNKLATNIPGIGRMTHDIARLDREYPREMAVELSKLGSMTENRKNTIVGVLSETDRIDKNIKLDTGDNDNRTRTRTRSRTAS
jgi:hypothetical protein